MDLCIITFRSVTPAQRGESLLRREGITCAVQRTPRTLAEQGCGYCIRLRCAQVPQAAELLRQRGIGFRKAYRWQDGSPEEVSL